MRGSRGRPRVLLFTSSPLEGSEGADKQLAAMIATRVADADFTWFTCWPASGRRLPGGRPFPVVSRDGMPTAGVRAEVTAAAAVLARRADLVHAVLTVGAAFPLLARLRRAVFGSRPVLHTVPGIMDPGLLGRAGPLGVTVALSRATARDLAAAGFGQVHVIPPAVSLAAWPRRQRADGLPVVLFAGHHDPGGGAPEAIAAAAVARRAGAAFRLVLAMRARPGQRAGAAARLAALARQQGLADTEILGHVTGMPQLLAAADVVLFPARSLSGKADIPLTVLEALATGRPVVISDLPQFADLGDGVIRVPAGGARQAGTVLAQLLTDPARWAAAAERGHAVVQARFSAGQFAAAYEALYRQLLGGG